MERALTTAGDANVLLTGEVTKKNCNGHQKVFKEDEELEKMRGFRFSLTRGRLSDTLKALL